MNKIRYICLSDLHFGQDMNLLTNIDDRGLIVPDEPSITLTRLLDRLWQLRTTLGGDQVGLVLNGDILEIALNPMNVAANCFARFVDGLTRDGQPLFDEIIYMPGNHDHHFFEMAREAAYTEYVQSVKADTLLERPWHATNLFMARAHHHPEAVFFNTLLNKNPHLKSVKRTLAYPNLGLEGTDRTILIHHGHYFEPLYRAMTEVANILYPDRTKPQAVWELEAENFSWIDFFWSSMGREGNVGPLVDDIYESLASEKALTHRVKVAIGELIKRADPPGPNVVYRLGLNLLARGVIKMMVNRERHQKVHPLSETSREGLFNYLEGPATHQMQSESWQPRPVSLIFGHTHKPYQENYEIAGFGQVPTFNTGGFVVETQTPSPVHGAGMVLIDEALNCAMIRCYLETDITPTVMPPLTDAAAPLTEQLEQHLKKTGNWNDLAHAITVDADKRRTRLIENNRT